MKDKTILNQNMFLENTSRQERLRFKIKCTSPFNYIVKPYEMTLAPQQRVNITIRAVIGQRELAAFGFDKF